MQPGHLGTLADQCRGPDERLLVQSAVWANHMQRRTRNAPPVTGSRVWVALAAGGASGIAAALILIAISTCCIDPSGSGTGLTLFRRATDWLWPTAGIMPAYLTGPIDQKAILARVALAVVANAIPYAALTALFLVARRWLYKHSGRCGKGRGETRSDFEQPGASFNIHRGS